MLHPSLLVLGPSRAQSNEHHNSPLILPPKRGGSEAWRVDRDLGPIFLVVPGFPPPISWRLRPKGTNFSPAGRSLIIYDGDNSTAHEYRSLWYRLSNRHGGTAQVGAFTLPGQFVEVRVIGASVLVADRFYHGGRCGLRCKIVRPAPSAPVGQWGGAVPTTSRETPQSRSLVHLLVPFGVQPGREATRRNGRQGQPVPQLYGSHRRCVDAFHRPDHACGLSRFSPDYL